MASVAAAWRSLHIHHSYTLLCSWPTTDASEWGKHHKAFTHPAAAGEDAPPCPHLAAPHLPPLPCVRPSTCSRAASTSFTLRGENQPPLVTGVRPPPPQPAQPAALVAVRWFQPAAARTGSSSLLPARFCAASFRGAAGQWRYAAGERNTRSGQPAATLPEWLCMLGREGEEEEEDSAVQ